MNKGCAVLMVSAFLFAVCACGERAVGGDASARCCVQCGGLLVAEGGVIQDRFMRIGTLLGNTWDVLGVMRSITISPPHRVRFLAGVVDDVVGILEEVACLSLSCELAVGHCRNFLVAFEDVGERFAGVQEAFNAVCVPACSGEERAIGVMVRRANKIFSECWARALKVDATLKADQRIAGNIMST